MNAKAHTTTRTNTGQIPTASTAVRSGVVLMVFGLFLVLATGFAGPSILHNAAHDTRHANSFPCH